MGVDTDVNSKEYAHKLKQHLLRGGDFGTWFFKGLTAPFEVASKLPIPGVQQIGQSGTGVAKLLGLPSLF